MPVLSSSSGSEDGFSSPDFASIFLNIFPEPWLLAAVKPAEGARDIRSRGCFFTVHCGADKWKPGSCPLKSYSGKMKEVLATYQVRGSAELSEKCAHVLACIASHLGSEVPEGSQRCKLRRL